MSKGQEAASRPGDSFTLRVFLLRRLLLLILPVVALTIFGHWRMERSMLYELFDQSLENKARSLATLVTHEQGQVEFVFADEFMPEFSAEPATYFFEVWHQDGRSLERSRALQGNHLPRLFGPLDDPHRFTTALDSGAELRCVGIEFPHRLGAGPASEVVIVVAASARMRAATLTQGYWEVGIIGLLLTMGLALAVFVTLRGGAHLLERITKEVEMITPNSLQIPLDTSKVPKEIRPVVQSLNRSLETLRGFVAREQRFHADVAHELRTPIAELRAAAEVALKWPEEETLKKLAMDAQAISVQMGALVDSLLELAHLQSQGDDGDPQEFDLAASIREFVAQAAKTETGGRSCELHLPEHLLLRSHPSLWIVVVRNLLSNAFSHSTPGSRIVVSLIPDGIGATLRVVNPAPQVSAADLDHFRERFWRADRASGQSTHFGLGLSIVEAACARLAHRISFSLESGSFHALVSRSLVAPVTERR